MLSFGCLCLLLGLGYWLRQNVVILRRLYLPASVVAGLIGLLLLQTAPLPPEVTAGWSRLPGILINVVFACLFLGKALPALSGLWRSAGRQLAYGQIVAWGQYAVAGLLVLLLLKPLLGVPDIFAGIMPVGFEGGHGTAGGMGPVFEELGFPEMKDFALASATGGIMGAILVGMGLVNWAIRKGYVSHHLSLTDAERAVAAADVNAEERLEVSADVIGLLSLQLVFVGTAILLGWLMKQGLLYGAEAMGGTTAKLLSSFPLFPLCMLGGVVVQWLADRSNRSRSQNGRSLPRSMDHALMQHIQNGALDFLVVAAIATIRIDVIAAGWVPLVLLIAAGIVWNVLCLTVLARRVFRDAWFERGLAEMGQSMGVTATGLLLLRVVDPGYKTRAAEAFAAKQLLHEPFMGGGLWTSTAIPLLALWGGWPVCGIALGVMALWSVVLLWMRRSDAG